MYGKDPAEDDEPRGERGNRMLLMSVHKKGYALHRKVREVGVEQLQPQGISYRESDLSLRTGFERYLTPNITKTKCCCRIVRVHHCRRLENEAERSLAARHPSKLHFD
jgi:hypothetical protein